MRPSQVTLALMIGTLGLLGAYAALRAPHAQRPAPGVQVVNRVWVNKVPKNDRDVVTHLVLLDRMKQRVAGVAHVSSWRLYVDRLRYRLDGDTLHLESPQDQTKATLKFRTWACPKEAPAPFDLCLELRDGRRKVTFYSERASAFAAPSWVGDAPQGACPECAEGDLLSKFDAQ